MAKSYNHHIGRVASLKTTEKHVYRPRVLCRGNAEYERLMAEAKQEFDEYEGRMRVLYGRKKKQ
jgi:hypothetical protein